MRIEKNGVKKKQFKFINAGEVFKNNEGYYMKIDEICFVNNLESGRREYFNCVHLEYGCPKRIESNTEVILINGSFVIKE